MDNALGPLSNVSRSPRYRCCPIAFLLFSLHSVSQAFMHAMNKPRVCHFKNFIHHVVHCFRKFHRV